MKLCLILFTILATAASAFFIQHLQLHRLDEAAIIEGNTHHGAPFATAFNLHLARQDKELAMARGDAAEVTRQQGMIDLFLRPPMHIMK